MRAASQTLTYTLKLHPGKSVDPDAKLKLLITMDLYAEACDIAARFAWDYGCETVSDIQEVLYYIIRKDCFLPSQMTCGAFRTVLGNIRAIRARERESGLKGSMPLYRPPFLLVLPEPGLQFQGRGYRLPQHFCGTRLNPVFHRKEGP